MGFSGQFVFGRSDRALVEAPVFDEVRLLWGDGAHELWPRPGGWQTLQFRDDRWGAEQLRALVDWSGAPACFAVIHDSDVAHVVGLAPGGQEWAAVLGLAIAAEMSLGRPEDVRDDLEWFGSPEYAQAADAARTAYEAAVPAAAEAAIAWAAAAGAATTGQDAVEAVRRSREVFVEDGFIALLDALGFPAAVTPAGETEA